MIVNHKWYIYDHPDCGIHECEWLSLVDALYLVSIQDIKHARIFIDSKMLHNHLTGKWRIQDDKLKHIKNYFSGNLSY